MTTYPALDTDKQLGQPDARGKLLRRAVWLILTHITRNGFNVVGIDDGEEYNKVATLKDAMELIFNLDEAVLYVKSIKANSKHYVSLTLCNDEPCDILTDWSFATDDGDGFNACMNKISDRLERMSK